MKKKILLSLLCLTLSIGVIGCGKTEAKEAPSEPAKVETPQKTNIDGEYTQKSDEDDIMTAEVKDGVITVNWYTKSDETKALYWKGTCDSEFDGTTYEWTSTGDTDTMSSAMLASQDSEKKFKYEDGIISFEMSMLGVTSKIKLEPVE